MVVRKQVKICTKTPLKITLIIKHFAINYCLYELVNNQILLYYAESLKINYIVMILVALVVD